MRGLDFIAISPPLGLSLAPILGLAVNVMAQFVISRLPLAIGHVRRQFLSFGCGLAAVGLWLALRLPSAGFTPLAGAGYVALHLLSYVMVGFIFFNVINLNISSLRIRMLKEYLREYPQPLADRVLREKYHTRGMLEARLERLTHGGQISQRGDRYYFQHSLVVVIGHFFAFLQKFLLHK